MKKRFGLEQSLVIRLLRSFLRDRLTAPGRVVFWLFLLANAVGTMSLVVRIYLVWCALMSLLVISIVAARVARVRLHVRADFPVRTTCGTVLTVPVHARNLATRRTAVDVEVRPLDLPDAVRLVSAPARLSDMAPDQTARGTFRLEFSRRGHFVLPGLRQDTLFPWGLWRDLVAHRKAHSLLVYPQFHPLGRLDIPVGRRYQPGGIALTSYLGDSTEFLSTREFRQGDSIRSIHWRSWARLGKPVVKEFQEEYFCRIALLLDTFLGSRPSDEQRQAFEAAVSLSAAVADSLARSEYVIDIFAAGPELYHFQAGRSLAYLENVMDILACIEYSAAAPFETIGPVLLECLDNITTTVVVLLDWDERRESLLRIVRERGSAVKAVVVRQQPPSMPLASGDDLASAGVSWLTPAQVREGVEDL